MSGRIVPVPFLVVEVLSVPVTLGFKFTEDHAHAILPQDRSICWTDKSVTAILRGPLDDGDRSMGVSCVLRSTHRTRLPPSAATVFWVRTMWGGLGQVFGDSRLFTTDSVTIANGVHDIVPGPSFPVIVSNFGAREVILRQRAKVGYVELLTTGVVQVPHGAAHETLPAPAFTTATAAEGVVEAVSGTRCDPTPRRGPDTAAPTDGGPRRQSDPGILAKGTPCLSQGNADPHPKWRMWNYRMPIRRCKPGSAACWTSTRQWGRARR